MINAPVIKDYEYYRRLEQEKYDRRWGTHKTKSPNGRNSTERQELIDKLDKQEAWPGVLI